MDVFERLPEPSAMSVDKRRAYMIALTERGQVGTCFVRDWERLGLKRTPLKHSNGARARGGLCAACGSAQGCVAEG